MQSVRMTAAGSGAFKSLPEGDVALIRTGLPGRRDKILNSEAPFPLKYALFLQD